MCTVPCCNPNRPRYHQRLWQGMPVLVLNNLAKGLQDIFMRNTNLTNRTRHKLILKACKNMRLGTSVQLIARAALLEFGGDTSAAQSVSAVV